MRFLKHNNKKFGTYPICLLCYKGIYSKYYYKGKSAGDLKHFTCWIKSKLGFKSEQEKENKDAT